MSLPMVVDKECTVISTFAGCGGSSLGYKWAGYKELLAIDFDKNAVETFGLNFDVPIWRRDIKTVTVDEILKFCNIKPGELDVLDGSPPCQGFSTAGKQEVSDNRNDLFLEYVRLIKGLLPKVFVMENVSGMMKGKFKGKFNEILSTLRDTGYNVKCKLMNAKYYEVPQSRERLIFIGVRGDLNAEPVYPVACGKLVTVGDAIKDIEPKTVMPVTKYFKEVMMKLKPGENGGKYYNGKNYSCYRLHPNKQSPTIAKTILFNRYPRTFHYKENRTISIEELKVLQGFSEEFEFMGHYGEQWARIGNSVPPKMMHHIARTIKNEILDKVE